MDTRMLTFCRRISCPDFRVGAVRAHRPVCLYLPVMAAGAIKPR